MSKSLTEDEIMACRKAFLSFDKDRSGTIDVVELKILLNEMRLKQSDADLAVMISHVDENNTGEVTYSGFLKLVEELKIKATLIDKQNDMRDAWVACGGTFDLNGRIDKEALINLLTNDFDLNIKVDELIRNLDTNLDDKVEFQELSNFLATPRNP